MPIEKKKKKRKKKKEKDAAIQYPLVYVVRLCMLGFFIHYTTQNVFFWEGAPYCAAESLSALC